MKTAAQMNAASMPVYLDHASTTPVDSRVAARMAEVLNSETEFGNPASSSHDYGDVADALVVFCESGLTRVPFASRPA